MYAALSLKVPSCPPQQATHARASLLLIAALNGLVSGPDSGLVRWQQGGGLVQAVAFSTAPRRP